MLTVLYAAKGGQGVTTVVAAVAAIESGPLVIDAAGDMPAALGVPEPTGAGLAWVLASDGPIEAGALAEVARWRRRVWRSSRAAARSTDSSRRSGPISRARCRRIVAIGSSTPGPDPL